MLARGSCFQSTSSDGQSCLMKLPSGQKAKMLAGDLRSGGTCGSCPRYSYILFAGEDENQ